MNAKPLLLIPLGIAALSLPLITVRRVTDSNSPMIAAAPVVEKPLPAGLVAAPEAKVALPALPETAEQQWAKSSPLEPMAAFQKWTALPAEERRQEDGVRLAQERRSALRTLIQNDPEQALANAVPESVRRALPAEVRGLLEEKVDARGTLRTAAASADRLPAGRRAAWTTAELDDGRRLDAYLYGLREFQPSRANVPIHGIAVDGALAVSQWPGRVLEAVERAEAKAALDAEPECPTSGLPVAEKGTETAVRTGRNVAFYCGPAHAQDVLEEAAQQEAMRPPGLGVRLRPVQDAASGGAGQSVPSPLSEGDNEWTIGTKRIVVVRVKFPYEFDEDTYFDYSDLTVSDCEEVVDNIRAAFLDWSYGRLNIRPVESGGSKVSPFVLLDDPVSDYDGGEIGDIWDEVLDKLEDDHGINPDNYDFVMVLAGDAPIPDEDDPDETVWWGGLGRIGEGLSFMRVNQTPDATRVERNTSVALHELGHNLGLYHSSNIWTSVQLVDGYPAASEEYGDRYDKMGRSGLEFNARYKHWLNWLDDSNLPLAVSDGVYTLREHDLEEKSGARGLQVSVEPVYVPLLGLKQIFVEYRLESVEPISGFPYIPYNFNLRAYGAQIRLGKIGSPKTWLLDTTPETPNWEPDDPVTGDPDTSGNVDSPLLPGRTFAYSRSGSTVYITNISADPDAGVLKVEVQHGPIAGNDPPSGSIAVSTPQGAKNQNIVFTANVTDPEDTDLAYHWQIPGFDDDSGFHPAVFPNARDITVKFPDTGTWLVRCQVSDKHGGTVTLTRNFSVIVNSPPSISAISDQSFDEDGSLSVPFTVSDATTPAGSLSVTVTSSNTNLFPASSLVLGGSGGNRTLLLDPPANRHGSAIITVQCNDGALTDSEPFMVTVHAVTPGTTLIAAGSTGWRYWATGTAPSGSWTAPAYDASAWGSDNSRFVYPAPVLNLLGWTVLPTVPSRTTCYFRRQFTMPASPTGVPVVKFLADDGIVIYNNGIEIWRHNMPDGPVAQNTKAESSVEGSAESEWITVPLGIAQFTAGASNTIAVEVHEGGTGRGGGDVTFDFDLALLSAPTISAISDKSSPEDQVAGPYNFSATDAESPGGPLTYTGTSSNQAIVLDSNIKFGFDLITFQRTVSCTPQPDATGITEIIVKVSDGASERWEKFKLNITPVNDAPWVQAVPDMATALGEIAPLVLVTMGDSDSPLEALTVTATSSNQAFLPNANIQTLPGPTPATRWLRLTSTAGIAAQANVTVNVHDGALPGSDVFIFRVTSPFSTTSTDVTLVQSGETWRYWASALPIDPRGGPVDFTDPNLDDRAWPSGPSQLGYGGDGEATLIPVTPYRITTYLRKKFTVPNAASLSQLKMRLLRDDGVVIYLNGTRIWTSNMPRTIITSTTPAEDAITGTDEDTWHTLTIGTAQLRSGSNTLAVELHQSVMPAALTPGDLSFDFEMDAVAAPAISPDTLIAPGSMWAYWDRDIYPDDTWKLATYVEDEWKYGLARLGYGIGGESTIVNASNTAGTQRNPAVLFRKTFDVADPAAYTSLHLYIQRDDGVAVHLNGTRVHLENLASNANLSTLAAGEEPSPGHTQWRHYFLDPKRLIPGTNLIAVEIHQASLSGTDLNFDLHLMGDLSGQPTLFMRPTGPDMELSWPAAYNGWNLMHSTNLSLWTPVPQPPLLDGAWIYVIQPGPGPRHYYRLEKP